MALARNPYLKIEPEVRGEAIESIKKGIMIVHKVASVRLQDVYTRSLSKNGAMLDALERSIMTKEKPSRRDRYWIILGEDGRHVTVGRHSDPSPYEIAKAEAGLVAQGLSGWLAIMEGAYYEESDPTLMMVRLLGQPERAFADAEKAFLAARRTALKGQG